MLAGSDLRLSVLPLSTTGVETLLWLAVGWLFWSNHLPTFSVPELSPTSGSVSLLSASQSSDSLSPPRMEPGLIKYWGIRGP